MLGYVVGAEGGATDALLDAVAAGLMAEGVALAGVVQRNLPGVGGAPGHMDLLLLAEGAVVRISQSLGVEAGCRLDPSGLAEAVVRVERALAQGPRIVILNKFGRAEVEGGGFRGLIGSALGQGVPVLTAVRAAHLAEFEAFCDGLGTRLAPDPAAIRDWVSAHIGPRAPV